VDPELRAGIPYLLTVQLRCVRLISFGLGLAMPQNLTFKVNVPEVSQVAKRGDPEADPAGASRVGLLPFRFDQIWRPGRIGPSRS